MLSSQKCNVTNHGFALKDIENFWLINWTHYAFQMSMESEHTWRLNSYCKYLALLH